MDTGIYYLYEYKNQQRLRNAGFMKITKQERTCFLQFNARGLPVTLQDTAKLSAFYMENDSARAAHLSSISCENHMISGKIAAAETLFPNQYPLNRIDGFFLMLPHGEILAATMPGTTFDTRKILFLSGKETSKPKTRTEAPAETAEQNPQIKALSETAEQNPQMKALSETTEPKSQTAKSEFLTKANPQTTEPDPQTKTSQKEPALDPRAEANSIEPAPEPQAEANSIEQAPGSQAETNFIEQAPGPQAETNSIEQAPGPRAEANSIEQAPGSQAETNSIEQAPGPQAETNSIEQAPGSQTEAPQEEAEPKPRTEAQQTSKPQSTARKIQRSELSSLPRRHWNLANNSFLLHGYYNYNHLLLVEEDGHYRLGVPGIYDPRESRAAGLFGFSQFTDSYNQQLALDENECSSYGRFGYWCRYLK